MQDERQDRHGGMKHMFASAAILQPDLPLDLPNDPRIPLQHLTIENILPSRLDLDNVKLEYIKLIVDIIVEHVPALPFMKGTVPSIIKGPYSDLLAAISCTVPFEVLPYNEQYYADDAKIMDNLETKIYAIHDKAGKPLTDDLRIHVGGDQLTRGRFSDTKHLCIGNLTAHSRFDHLGPISFELFHLDLNFLEKPIIKWLYKESFLKELGTLQCEQKHILCNNVDKDVHKAYDADQAYVISFIRSFVAAVLKFFGMTDVNDCQTVNIPPPFDNDDQRQTGI